MTLYKNIDVYFTVDFSAPGYKLDIKNFKFEYSDYLNEEFENPLSCRGLSMYENEDQKMQYYFIVDNAIIEKKYIIFKYQVGNNFPLWVSYYGLINKYIKKEEETESADFFHNLYNYRFNYLSRNLLLYK